MAFYDKDSFLTIEEGWPILQDGIDKIIGIIEGVKKYKFTSEEYMNLYTTAFNICRPNSNNPRCHVLYNKHIAVYDDYITSKVLPHLKEKKDESLLQEVVKRWNNHKLMTRWTCRFFRYLDKYFVIGQNLPTLQQSTYSIFHKLVLVPDVRNSLLSMINRERNGEEVNQTLVKSAIEMYLEIGIEYYRKDFEDNMLNEARNFYKLNSLKWINSKSYNDYMVKVAECTKKEKERVRIYFREITGKSLIKAVECELLSVHSKKLEEKKMMEDALLERLEETHI